MNEKRRISRIWAATLLILILGSIFGVGMSQWESVFTQSKLDEVNSQTIWDDQIEAYRIEVEKLESVPPTNRSRTDANRLKQLIEAKSRLELRRKDHLEGFRVHRLPGKIEVHVFEAEHIKPNQKAALLRQMRELRGDRDNDIRVRMTISDATYELTKEIANACPACEF